ncbi:hypothetical protein QEJ31_02565 [Pigmentibacter sp. JX0631]|uniref:hypothetical protein n=1 Tax=Pigmentibacter sp. JX0631 TaxID=2976982 RepID=UPI002468FB1E|nr:hypothetical protein [Pigmentibacter sp. JX0631]WGL60484.1 hypothetical protein QEJ31_02565 [Pigmentibacter sp. JX0631]
MKISKIKLLILIFFFSVILLILNNQKNGYEILNNQKNENEFPSIPNIEYNKKIYTNSITSILKEEKENSRNQNIYPQSDENTEKEIIYKFTSMVEYYNHINFEEYFNSVYNYLKNFNNIETEIKKILLDPSFAISTFQNNQSYARVFSIKFLQKLALDGNEEPLLTTLSAIAINISDKKFKHQGIEADLEDLIYNYVDLYNSNDFINNFDMHMEKIKFKNNKYSQNVREIYDDAIYYKLVSKNKNKEEIKKIMEKHFAN